MSESTFQPPPVVSRDEWTAARRELLAKEKEATRAGDALNAARRRLPMVEIEKEYAFEGPDGRATLPDLFEGRRQLIVYHFMFDPEWDEGCSGCSHVADNIPELAHLHARDTTLVMVSRAPLAKIEAFKARMGWTMPWYSSHGSDFNYDFHATTDESVAPVEYNFRDKGTLEEHGETYHVKGEQPGASVFLRDGGRIFHTYSTYGRGLDILLTTHHYLDLTPFGRGEGWGGMPDLGGQGMGWLKHHDRYAAEAESHCCGSAADAAREPAHV
ncbi:MAG TPA: DUF899 domain-containing protein [Longimicrobium sp.]|nr:DUF899 domain-containing protein [Longimicrobium sp.]